MPESQTKAERRAARETVSAYHEQELARLLEHVRDALDRFEAGEIDAFAVDDVIHQYKRAAQKLWSACVGSGAGTDRMARALAWQAAEGERTDWWQLGAPLRRSDG